MKLFRKKDGLLFRLLLFDNLITLQLALMAPSLTISTNSSSCMLITALLFITAGVVFYFISDKVTRRFYDLCRYLPAPVIASAVSVFYTRPLQAIMCGALTAVSEFILVRINERIRASSIRPALRLIAELISAGILATAVLGLRF